MIAAELDNATGIAGLAPSAELLIAKVVAPGGTISVEAEAKAIRWAVDNGARVVNVSLGGLRDPRNPDRDTFSRLEQEAVAYAVKKGAVVVAAVGNADQAPDTPWRFASYPAALPHVLGVSALTRSGSSPSFSNRDAVYNDVAAPGEDIFSTFPRSLTAERHGCADQGYTPCASDDFRPPEGTSFAAPQASAVAANLLGARPLLRPEQVIGIIERTAVDANASTGCSACALGRDEFTGWGALDGTAAVGALGGAIPPRDGLEPNDDAGDDAYRLYFTAARRRASRRRPSTSGTTRTTSTASTCGAARSSSPRSSRACRAASCSPSGGQRPSRCRIWPARSSACGSRTGPDAASASASGRTRRAGTSSRRASRSRPSPRSPTGSRSCERADEPFLPAGRPAVRARSCS